MELTKEEYAHSLPRDNIQSIVQSLMQDTSITGVNPKSDTDILQKKNPSNKWTKTRQTQAQTARKRRETQTQTARKRRETQAQTARKRRETQAQVTTKTTKTTRQWTNQEYWQSQKT